MNNLPAELKDVQVTQDGKNVMRPDVMQFLVQAASLSQLVKMRKSQERMEEQTNKWQDMQIPTGTISFIFNVGTEVTELKFRKPLTAFAFDNKGPGNVKMKVNTNDNIENELPILSGDGYYYDFKFAIVKSIFFLGDAVCSIEFGASEGKEV